MQSSKSKRNIRQKSLCSVQTRIVYFIDWESTCKEFVQGINFTSSSLPRDTKVHLFYNKDTSKAGLPKDCDWIVKHSTLTSSSEASWTALITYVIYFYTHLACSHTDIASCQQRACHHVHKRYKAYVVCGDESRYEELSAILKHNKVAIRIIKIGEKTLLDVFPFTCTYCKMIFSNKQEATRHDHDHHNFLCRNSKCEKSKRDNGFFNKSELNEHLAGQKSCIFCPDQMFCSRDKLELHIKQNHKRCDCPCEVVFKTNDDYLEHFYSRLPLPCLEDPSCTARFPNIEHQAFHHKAVHGSTYPYYCMACYKNNYLVCLKTAEELLEHVEQVEHQEKDFSFAQIPLKYDF